MATGTTPTTSLPNEFTESEQLIERQLLRVRRHIRFADFITALVLLTAGLLGFFVLAAVTDHWIIGLGVWGRWTALLVVLAGVGWYVGTRLVPFLVMQINPAYAAQTIERSEPSLKNSLLNYLLLRRDPTAIHQRVYDAIRQRAAVDVSKVAVDQAVDRSALIRAGYVLVAIMALAAAYKILSPKDPLQTARRIVSPWADIARPARVTIESVEPGDAEFYHGQTVAVSAIVRGVRDVEPVTLVYSTSDGQTVDKHVPMKLDSSGFRHSAELPPDRSGLRSDLVFRLEAGDCVTRDFQIRAIAAPMIEVQAIEYEFPAYTLRPREVVQGQGDIHAVEGTRVTIRAKTNQPIRSALLEFDPAASPGSVPGSAAGQPTPATERLVMEIRELSAWRNFRLELAGDRRSARHSSYQLTFVNSAGRGSFPPVVYRIDVTPDLGPEIEFLSPTRERIEVPVSGEQKIEIRAIDPDYGLTRVRIKSIRGSTELFDKVVHESVRGQSGQVVTTFMFRPQELGLKADDQVTYWAVAEDNRTAVGSDSPEPNSARTRNYTILVVPDPKADPSRDQEQEKPAENPEGNDNQQDTPTGPFRKENNTEKKQKSNDQQGPQEKQSKPEEKQNGKNEQKGQEGASSKAESGQEKQQSSPSSQQDGGGKQGGGSNQNTPDSKSQTGQGSQASESGGNTPQENGKGATGTSAGANPGGKGEQREGPSGNNRSEPAHDGEVFEKTLRRIQDEQGTGKKNEEKSSGGENAKGSDQNSKGPSEKEREQEKSDPTQQRNATGAETEPKPGAGDTQDRPAGEAPAQDGTKKDGTKKDGQKKEGEGAKHPDANQGEGKPKEGAPGEGGKTARGGMERPEKKDANTKEGAKDGGKKPGLSDNGESGAGQNTKDKNGSGSVEEIAQEKIENRDRPKTQQPNSQEPMDPGDPGTTKSKKQSDSEGGQSGDESGGGKQGSGQGAKQPGNDSAGSNSSSDDGAGNSQESGKGNTSKTGGNDRTSATPTGSPGAEKGPGSKSSDAGGDKQSGEKNGTGAGSSAPKSEQEKRKSDNTKEQGGSGSTGDGSSSTPTGGGAPSERPEGKPPVDGGGQPGDAANLDYARRATDMVIDYLEHKKGESDQELMDELGWKPGDLEAFLERWKKLKQSAVENPAARRELEESLRSLGLRRTEDARRTGGTRSDDNRGLRESGVRSAPPSTYQEQFNAFKKGSSRGNRPPTP